MDLINQLSNQAIETPQVERCLSAEIRKVQTFMEIVKSQPENFTHLSSDEIQNILMQQFEGNFEAIRLICFQEDSDRMPDLLNQLRTIETNLVPPLTNLICIPEYQNFLWLLDQTFQHLDAGADFVASQIALLKILIDKINSSSIVECSNNEQPTESTDFT